MKLNRALREATKIISVDLSKSMDAVARPKAGLGTNKVIYMDKKKEKIIPKVLDKKEFKDLEYYIPSLPDGAWETIPPEFKRFYHDSMNSYPEVTWQPLTSLAKWRLLLNKMKKKYPNIEWDKLFPKRLVAKVTTPKIGPAKPF